MQIFLDESGYTGQHLLDPEQPVFAIGTIGVTEEQCAELKARFFAKVRAPELKYSSLVRRPSQQRMVLDFLAEVVGHSDHVKVSTAHKTFVVVTKMVDLLTENHARAIGFNLYKDGMHLGLSNLLYFGLPAICGKEFFGRLLSAFERAMTERTHEAFTAFRMLLFSPDLTDEQREWLVYFQAPVRDLGFRFFEEIGDQPLDLALTCGAHLMGSWRADNRTEAIELIHDESSNMAGQEDFWEFFMSKDREPFERIRSTSTAVFPIALERTTFSDSRSWAGLQLADVLAGAFADAGRWLVRGCPEDPYRDELWHGIVKETPVALPLWPDFDIERVAAERKGTNLTEELDYMVSEMARAGLDTDRRR